jgi:hypothetical protein
MLSGFTFGGPVWMPFGPLKRIGRQKMFLFTSFEFNPSESNIVVTLTNPTAAEAAGNFAGVLNSSSALVVVKDPANGGAPFPGNVIPSGRFNQYGAALLQLINKIQCRRI